MKISKRFIYNLASISFIFWVITIAYFSYSVLIHQNNEIWTQRDSNFLISDMIIGVVSFLLALFGWIVFINGKLKKSHKTNSSITSKPHFRSFNPWFVISMILLFVISYLAGNSNKLSLFENMNKTAHPNPTITITPLSIDSDKLWNLIQNWRKENKRSELEIDSDLCNFARSRISELKENWSSDPFKTNKDFSNWDKAEVSSKDNYSENDIFQSWLNNSDTANSLKGNYKYGCLIAENSFAEGIFANKPIKKSIKLSNSTTAKSDLPVHCNIHQNCGGGTKPLKESECEKSTCCQINGKWIFYMDKNQCIKDQGQNIKFTVPQYIPIPNNPLRTCFVSYPCTGNSYTYQLDSATCLNAQNEAARICSSNSNTYVNNYYVIPNDQSVQQAPQMTKNECISNVNEKYRSLMGSQGCYYPCPDSGECGGSNICEAYWYEAKKEINSCNQFP